MYKWRNLKYDSLGFAQLASGAQNLLASDMRSRGCFLRFVESHNQEWIRAAG